MKPRTVFDKYRDLQQLFKRFQAILVSTEGQDDATMKRIEKAAKDKLVKLTQDLKAGIQKLENSSDVASEIKTALEEHLNYIKENSKGRLTGVSRKVFVVEDPKQGLIVYYVVLGAYTSAAKDATDIHLSIITKESLADGFKGNVVGLHRDPAVADREQILKIPVGWNEKLPNGFYFAEAGALSKVLSEQVLMAMSRNGFKGVPQGVQILDKAKTLMQSLRFPRQDEMDDQVEQSAKSVSRNYRDSDYFTERSGVEDDDHPNFTGEKEAQKVVERHFSEILKSIDIELWGQEKGWFTVSVTAI